MLNKRIIYLAKEIIEEQEKSTVTGVTWRTFKIHDGTTIEVVAAVDCDGSLFQVPLLVNLETEEVLEK